MLIPLALTVVVLSSTVESKNKVLMVSFDGFRYDYFNKTSNITNFNKLIKSGVTMPYMNNTFVTRTFPCHYTMATGLYPESHGIIANKMYDPELDKYFNLGSIESYWWEGGEPVWITAVKSGLKAGVYYWAGSEASIKGVRPTQYKTYNKSVPYEERVTTMIDWLSKEDFDLGVQYFEEPDATGHTDGPDSKEIVTAIEKVDYTIGLILSKIEEAGLKDKLNLIVLSDHGMSSIDVFNRIIDVSNYANSTLLDIAVDDGPTANLRPKAGKAAELAQALANVSHLHVFLKENIPERFHHRNHRRIMPVFAYADEGWMITTNATKRQETNSKGDHGYDNQLMVMKPFFIASGPEFKTGGQVVTPIMNLDIYPLICHLLNITAAPNNGSLDRAMALLRETNTRNKADVYGVSLFPYILPFVLSLIKV